MSREMHIFDLVLGKVSIPTLMVSLNKSTLFTACFQILGQVYTTLTIQPGTKPNKKNRKYLTGKQTQAHSFSFL